jgi:putative spermidine/putrescine transport system ATP-binding protein
MKEFGESRAWSSPWQNDSFALAKDGRMTFPKRTVEHPPAQSRPDLDLARSQPLDPRPVLVGSAHVSDPVKRDRESRTNFVEIVGVEKTFDGERLAIANLNLSIAQGEFLTLLGPSGSGKTTSLMMLAGFEEPTSGEIRLNGRSLSKVPPHRRNMGVVFQNYALFPHMTVAENLAFPLSVRGVSRAEIGARVERVLQLVRLKHLGSRRPTQLSGGQQQRVALARALIFDPDLVLMDEPLGALDKQLREQLQIEIKHIQEDLGVTVVYVTHDQSEALTMSDRIAVFNNGTVQQVAPPEELYERPCNAFVAQFIGESNRFEGTILRVIDEYCVVRTEDGLEIAALSVNIGPPGSRTTISLRPEHVALGPACDGCDNVVEARVEELIYHGDHTRVSLHVTSASDFIIKVPNAHGKIGLSAGEIIQIGWRKVDCRALDAPEESGN